VSVNPATVTLLGGATQAFTATVTNDSANAGVTWSIGTGAGTLSANTTTGVTYTAPATVTTTATVTLTATSITDKTKSSSATITLSPPPITVTISPATVTLTAGGTQAFAATLTNDTANAGVTWSIGTGAGALSASTNASVTYTAPNPISAAATVTLTATSITDKTKSGSAAITLSTAPPPTITAVSVSCNPTSFETWGTSQCTPTVTGTGSYSSTVTWSVSGVAGGNSTVGVVSSTGVYTAPNTVPAKNPVAVTATSTADTTKSGSANLTITAASGTPSITALSEKTASPFDAITITGTAFNQGTGAVSVIFTPESGDPAVMVPVSSTTATSLGVMVPPFTDASGTFTAETVDVQVFLYSTSKTWLTNTIKALPVAVLPAVSGNIPAGTMTAALLSAATNTSTTVQGIGKGVADFAPVPAALSQLSTDISPLSKAATTIAGAPSQTVTLTTANGATTPMNAKILAQTDQLAQAMFGAIANQASIPTASSTTACPAATGNTAFDNNLCNAQIYFQTYASQATPTGAAQCLLNPESSVLSLTPPDRAAITLFTNLALFGISEACLPPAGGLLYSVVGAPIVTTFISSLAANQETPSGTDLAQGVGLAALDEAVFAGVPIIGTSVDMFNAFAAFIKYSPPVNGILLSTGMATFAGNGETFISNGTTTTLVKVPNAPNGGSFDSTSLVISESGLLTLSESTNGSGTGSIATFPTGTQFPKGTVVLLTAVPDSGSTFTAWGGACSGTGSCVVTMSAPQSVSATFTKSSFNLTVSTSGTGTGSVAATPTGTACGSGCTSYATGTVVTLTATAASGSTFAGWSGGGCSGTGTCSVTMNADESVTATFNQNLLDLTFSTSGNGSGSIAADPVGAICGSDCYSYASGTAVTLTATPTSGSTFEGWSGACSGTGDCKVTMTTNLSVVASFSSTTTGTTPAPGTYSGECLIGVSSFTCTSGGQSVTEPAVNESAPFSAALPSGTSLNAFTTELCSDWNTALASSAIGNCASSSVSCSIPSATSNTVDFGFACTIPEVTGCTTATLSISCNLTLQ
jgi:hypothetical protein